MQMVLRVTLAERDRCLGGGDDAATLGAETRRATTSVVFQHPYLFDGSIRDNIPVARR